MLICRATVSTILVSSSWNNLQYTSQPVYEPAVYGPETSGNSREQFTECGRAIVPLAFQERWSDDDGIVVALKPRNESGLFRSAETLLVEPRVVRAHVGVDQ